MMKDYSIFLVSNKPDRYSKIQESLLPELLYYHDGSNARSFSHLVNSCIASSLTETVIIASDKVYPTSENVDKIIQLLDLGYGLVGLYRFAFFGLKKELFRKIGMFDERFIGGGFEDNDIVNRLILSNIAFYFTEEVRYMQEPSSWNYDRSGPHYLEKWRHHWDRGPLPDVPLFEKTLIEEKYEYDLGKSVPIKFLPCRDFSYVDGDSSTRMIIPFMKTEIITSVPLEFINK